MLANNLSLARCISVAAAVSVCAPARRSRSWIVTSSLRYVGRFGNCRRISHGVAYQRYTRFTLPFAVGHLFRYSAWPMKVQVGVQVALVEFFDFRRVRCSDMRVAQVLSHHRSILALRQPIVVAVPRPRLGLLDQQLLQ